MSETIRNQVEEEEEEKGGEGEMLGKPASQISPHAARCCIDDGALSWHWKP
jgi:hypothetical protein